MNKVEARHRIGVIKLGAGLGPWKCFTLPVCRLSVGYGFIGLVYQSVAFGL